MRTLISVMTGAVSAIFLSSSLSFAAEAEASQCPLINCDCDSLMDSAWQESCQQRQKRLQQSCEARQGKLTGFCYVSGPQAYPVALSIKPKSQAPVDATEKQLREKIKSLKWSMDEERQVALSSQNAGKYRQALLLRKRENKTRKQIFQLQKNLSALWSAEGDIDEVVDYWQAVTRTNQTQTAELETQAQAVWQQGEEAEDDKLKAMQQRLATRLMSNLGALLEQIAYAHIQAGQPQQAVDVWQQSARKAEQLVEWQQAANAKASHINFYQQQAAARWFRAALIARQTDQVADAQVAHDQALKVLGIDAKQVAGG